MPHVPATTATLASDPLFSRAEAYERFMGRWSRLLTPEFLVFSEVTDGQELLDVGSGTGALSFAARDATHRGRIVGVDLSPDYVALASKSDPGPRVHFQVGDAQQLAFPAASFDRALSLLVLNFVPEPAKAVQEMRRVTRKGGFVSAAVWDYPEGMQMLRQFWDQAIALDPTLAPLDEAKLPLCTEGALGELFKAQGLLEVKEEPLVVTLHFTSFDDYWAPFLLGQGPAGALVAKLPADRQAALAARLRTALLGSGPDHPFDLQARAWAARGTVP